MTEELRPFPNADEGDRPERARNVRDCATRQRINIGSPAHEMNHEHTDYAPHSPTTFTKGLPHNKFGIVDAKALEPFVRFLNQDDRTGFAYSDPTGIDVPLGPKDAYRGDPNEGPVLPSHPSSYNPSDGVIENFQNAEKNDKGDKYLVRAWESPLAGHVYDLEGPDADRVSMPPAPKLGSGELTAEMAEVYALALLRDKTFAEIEKLDSDGDAEAQAVMAALKKVQWFTAHSPDKYENARREARLEGDALTSKVAFRGSTKGAKIGPYISQFMLIGNAGLGNSTRGALETTRESAGGDAGPSPVQATEAAPTAQNFRGMLAIAPDPALLEAALEKLETAGRDNDPAMMEEAKQALNSVIFGPRKVEDGYILYGAQEINQKVSAHEKGEDFLTNWPDWIDVQNGKDTKNEEKYEEGGRFITTPRDLATYVHFDALYQAYLNACLLMLGYGRPADRGFPEGGHSGTVRDAFATFGGPHILSLLTEVATRALKFARRQKFNIHLRARPEAIAGILSAAAGTADSKAALGSALADAETMLNGDLSDMLALIKAKNPSGGDAGAEWLENNNYLLPMAFGEGSPMHPSYAAGHATVAGACVTVLKAFFEMFDDGSWNVEEVWTPSPFASLYGDGDKRDNAFRDVFKTGIFEPNGDGKSLRQLEVAEAPASADITILGELDKLAANISIGRDMAGVHYYTDYYESLRMGERVAIGILQEQMLTYPEPVRMRLLSFDGDQILIDGKGDGGTGGASDSTVFVGKPDGHGGFRRSDFGQWWRRGL